MIGSGGRRRFRAGDSLEDLCRPCKAVRGHTVIVADPEGRALRVICDYCGSQHNYRGARIQESGSKPPPGQPRAAPDYPVTERERRFPVVNVSDQDENSMDLEMLLRRIIREETGLTPVAM